MKKNSQFKESGLSLSRTWGYWYSGKEELMYLLILRVGKISVHSNTLITSGYSLLFTIINIIDRVFTVTT